MEKKVKKGDVVTVYDAYSRTPKVISETKVATSGKEWITTERDRMKYFAKSLHSEYLGHALFIGTKEECEKFLTRREDVKAKARELYNFFFMGTPEISDFDFIDKVYEMYKEHKSEG